MSRAVFSYCSDFVWLFVFLEEFRISFSINGSLQDNNKDKVMLVSQSQPVPHTVQVTMCLHYGEPCELLEGLWPGDGKAPTKLIFVHKNVWQSDKSI